MLRLTLLVLCCCIFATIVASPTTTNLTNEWSAYKTLYNKHYAGQEDTKREKVFQINLDYVNEHNQRAQHGLISHRLAMNQFSDLSIYEMKTRLTKILNVKKSVNRIKNISTLSDVPLAFDWRNNGAVGPVIDARQFGVSSLYAGVGAVEGRRVVGGKTPFVTLSTQQLIDCSILEQNDSPTDIFDDISYAGGIETEANYPSTGVKSTCAFNQSSDNLTKVLGYEGVPGDEVELMSILYYLGPLAALIDASDPAFQLYTSGVYTSYRCTDFESNHAVLIVGYGTDYVIGSDYWILKNSWGTNWGEDGYVRIERGFNMCGVAKSASFPILA